MNIELTAGNNISITTLMQMKHVLEQPVSECSHEALNT